MAPVNSKPDLLWPATIVTLVLFSFLYWPSISSIGAMWSDWVNENYTHGFLIFGISLYLVWQSRHQLRQTPICPSWAGVLLALILTIFWLFAYLTSIQMVHQLAVLGVFGAVLLALFGKWRFRPLIFPVGFLVFALPVWEPLTPILQQTTALVSYRALNIVGIPALLEGSYIHIPAGVFHVEQSCSGARYFNASLALGFLYAYLYFGSWAKRAVCVVVSAIIPIMANWLRVTIVVLAGELTAMQHPLVHSHITFGWILFGSLILPACWFGARFSDIGRRDVQTKAATEDEPGIERRFGIVTAATIAAMTVGPSYAQWIYHTATGPTSARPLTLPDGLGEWVTVTSVGTSWKPAFDGVSREAQATYERGGKYIHLYVADYDNPQSQGHELVAQMNSIANKSRWRIVDSSRRKWDGVSGVKMTVGESEIASGIGDRLLVWYWYRIAGRFTSDPYVAKLLEAWALIAGWKVSSLIAVATTAREDDLESSRSLLADFVQDFSYLSHGEATALR